MTIGAFSVSLAVKDIHVSKAFYEKLGFTQFGGDIEQNWVIMKNGDTVIGLFQGMFSENLLTFNPGWDLNSQEVDPFTDVRDLQKDWQAKGIALTTEVDETTSGPGFITLQDPDGNQILVDQHR